ncbi:metal-dependent hydrolase [Rummeliibacillus stabekisii]|uniref:metal-dependent hydrolase n=1 Tax=Rummeliibacillus stabekisii TaxID=241244 RepID=UPI00371EC31C
MTGKTHIIGGIAACLAFGQTSVDSPLLLGTAGAIGALIPDICHGGSMIGRTFPTLSKLINGLFGHRSFTHSLLFLLIVAWILHIYVTNDAIKMGLLIGMASHFVLDMCTKQGIQLFFPIKVKVRFPLTTRTGSKIEGAVALCLLIACLYFSFEIMHLH